MKMELNGIELETLKNAMSQKINDLDMEILTHDDLLYKDSCHVADLKTDYKKYLVDILKIEQQSRKDYVVLLNKISAAERSEGNE